MQKSRAGRFRPDGRVPLSFQQFSSTGGSVRRREAADGEELLGSAVHLRQLAHLSLGLDRTQSHLHNAPAVADRILGLGNEQPLDLSVQFSSSSPFEDRFRFPSVLLLYRLFNFNFFTK